MTPIEQYHALLLFFKEQIDNDYVYLDVPAYLNVGDMLIAMGAFEVLKQIPYRCVYRSTYFNEELGTLPDDCIILMQGGGNFGDLYPGANWYRMQIAQRYPNNKIIILPVTTTYVDEAKIEEESMILSRHPNLHICARDKQSFDFLKKGFSNSFIHLVPDCAFGLGLVLPQKNTSSGQCLYIKRKDSEIASEIENNTSTKIVDWDDILQELHFPLVLFGYKVTRKIRKLFPCSLAKKLNDLYLIKVEYSFLLKKIPIYFLRFDRISTTRMHGFILAYMLGIPSDWEDTKYGKISAYVKTWMNDGK